MTAPTIDPYATTEELQEATADAFCELVSSVTAATGQFRVALSGGSTPRRLHELLAKRDLPWQQMHFFWGDERNVPHDDEDSNYRMARETLLDHVPVPDTNIHPVPVDTAKAWATAEQYEATLREQFAGDTFPAFDLVLLGMGSDAHTASLFPHTDALGESDRWFVDNWVEEFDTFRYTLTPPAINSAKEIWFLVSGEAKQGALQSVWSDEKNPVEYPSQLIQATRWFVTRDAMSV
tara:strand:- start:955188 stop:955895 length:708 start_codon:yes stop_codon:yes gene_type:complete